MWRRLGIRHGATGRGECSQLTINVLLLARLILDRMLWKEASAVWPSPVESECSLQLIGELLKPKLTHDRMRRMMASAEWPNQVETRGDLNVLSLNH